MPRLRRDQGGLSDACELLAPVYGRPSRASRSIGKRPSGYLMKSRSESPHDSATSEFGHNSALSKRAERVRSSPVLRTSTSPALA